MVREDKRLGEVLRVHKRPSSFVMMDKGFLENPELSWKAKGILAYLLSKPDDWHVIVKDVINHSIDGKGSVYAGLNELKEQGHYSKVPIRDESGKITHWESNISECRMSPSDDINSMISPLTDFPYMENQDIGKPYMDKPFMENWDDNNNYYTKNDLNNNNLTKNSQNKNYSNSNHTIQSVSQSIEIYRESIAKNIDFDGLRITHPSDTGIIDEIVSIIVDVIISTSPMVKIGGEDKPRELVKQGLMELGYEDIAHVLDSFKSHTEHIKNKRAYLLTMLYNSKMELNAHYTNAVIADRVKGGGQ